VLDAAYVDAFTVTMTESQLPPEVRGRIPGTAGARLVDVLAQVELPAFTARRARRANESGAPHDPIVWARARGINVWDADDNRYVDLSAGFGAAAIGHAHPRVLEAIRDQSDALLHALGDLHPSRPKISLLERLCALAPMPSARALLVNSGSDAVEVALKTAALATGKPGVLAFTGGYHGLGYGALAICGYADAFRKPFERQLNPHVRFAPYPSADDDVESAIAEVERAWGDAEIGGVVLEPVLGRGGVQVPPEGFVRALGALCRARGALLIVDEILTGLGRTGVMFASAGTRPDVVLVGKALGAGLPIAACIGREDVMDAWGSGGHEAIHTGTFFGNPLGSAAALAALDVIEDEKLCDSARATGAALRETLGALAARHDSVREVRGVGLLVGVELDTASRSLALVRALLERGYITVPAGPGGRVLSLTPALSIERASLDGFVEALDDALGALA
jgi:4-aminobutyrate aminotransferase/(S)-3-amino-2-methylpropionate transaminase